MECADAGTYASIVCHYCIDVPKLVCESICASGLGPDTVQLQLVAVVGLAWALGGRGLVLRRLLRRHPSLPA